MTLAIRAVSAGIVADALALLTVTSMCYYVLTVVASLVVSRGRRLRGTRPRASLLVPLCGSHPSLAANLEAFRAALVPLQKEFGDKYNLNDLIAKIKAVN